MDPFSLSTGGGGVSGGDSDATSRSSFSNTFGDSSAFGANNYNIGSGSLSANTPNYWVIGGLAAAALVAVWLLKR